MITVLALWGLAKDRKGIPIGTVYHCTCDSCGYRWEMSGIQKYLIEQGQKEEAAKWNMSQQPDGRDKH